MGVISGIGQVIFYMILISVMWICEFIFPAENIEIAENFNSENYITNPEKFGNHFFNVAKSTT